MNYFKFLTLSCHSLSKSISTFCAYGNILGDLGSKSSAASDSLSNSGKVTFSFEACWERHSYGHFSPVLFTFLVYLESGIDFKGYSDS